MMRDPYPEVDYEKWIDSQENVIDCNDYPECPLIKDGIHDCMLMYLERGSLEENKTSFAEICYRICQLRNFYHNRSIRTKIGEKDEKD